MMSKLKALLWITTVIACLFSTTICKSESAIKPFQISFNLWDMERVAEAGNVVTLREMLEAYKGWPTKDQWPEALSDVLIYAIRAGCSECVSLMLKNGANPNVATSSFRETPLIQAIEGNNAAIIKMLLEAGAEEEMLAPLKQRTEEIALALLEEGGLKQLEEESLSASAFAVALMIGNVEIIRYMYERISWFNIAKKAKYRKIFAVESSRESYTQIHSLPVLKCLHELGFPLGGSNGGFNIYSLYLAVAKQNFPVIDFLLDEAKVPLLNSVGNEIRPAVEDYDSPDMLRKLLEYQKRRDSTWLTAEDSGLNAASAQFPAGAKETVLQLATEKQNIEMVKLLLEYGADPNQFVKGDGPSPFALAIKNDNRELMQLLLKAGAKPNSPVKLGTGDVVPAWFSSLRRNKLPLAIDLLASGADATAVSSLFKSTALHKVAAAGGAEEIELASLLLKAGVSLDARDSDGNTAFSIAVRENRMALAKFFLAQGAETNVAFGKKSLLQFLYDDSNAEYLVRLNELGIVNPEFDPLYLGILKNQKSRLAEHLEARILSQEKKNVFLTFAVFHARLDAVRALLSLGATANSTWANPRSDEKESPLLALAIKLKSNDTKDIVDALLAAGANPNVVIGAEREIAYQVTPLWQTLSERTPSADLVEVLLRRGANPNEFEIGSSQTRVLTLAAKAKDPRLIELMLQYGARVGDSYRGSSSDDPVLTVLLEKPKYFLRIVDQMGGENILHTEELRESLLRRLSLESKSNLPIYTQRENLETVLAFNDVRLSSFLVSLIGSELINKMYADELRGAIIYGNNEARLTQILHWFPQKQLFNFEFTNTYFPSEKTLKNLPKVIEHDMTVSSATVLALLSALSNDKTNSEYKEMYNRFYARYEEQLSNADRERLSKGR